jgi:hypothetical protein
MIIRTTLEVFANDSDLDSVLRSFYGPDMWDSIAEAINRYMDTSYVQVRVLEAN